MTDAERASYRALVLGLERAEERLAEVAKWRERAHDYDDDNGQKPREFYDEEDWQILEAHGERARADAANVRAVVRWNEQYTVGTTVRYWTFVREGPGKESTTRTPAVLNAAHSAVIWMEGERSSVSLTHVEAIAAPAAAASGGGA